MKNYINLPESHDWTGEEIMGEYERIGDKRKLAKVFCLPLRVINGILQSGKCGNKDCLFDSGSRCLARDGCAGYERRGK